MKMPTILRFTGLALTALLALALPRWRRRRSGTTTSRLSASRSIPRASSASTTSIPTRPRAASSRLGDMGSFDTFNPILPQGEVATGLGLIYETLMTPVATTKSSPTTASSPRR